MNKELWEKIFKRMKTQQFELGIKTSLSWIYVARNLKHAADRLFAIHIVSSERIIKKLGDEAIRGTSANGMKTLSPEETEEMLDASLITTYYFPIGLSLENLLKGILVKKKRDEITPWNRKFPDFIRCHDLLKIANKCGLNIDNEESILLEKFSEYIIWRGRYPTPTREEEMYPLKTNDGSWKSKGEGYCGDKKKKVIDKLYIKLLNEIRS
ncbi:MAG: hypothetical protein ACTSYF_12870 [Promethearchaeota archaeon]